MRVVYVIELDDGIGKRTNPDFPNVYVGETGQTARERFQTHMAGGPTASRWVTDHGLRLLPKLYQELPEYFDETHSVAAEKKLARRPRNVGYTVWGAKMGMSESFRASDQRSPTATEEAREASPERKVAARPEMPDCIHGMYPADCDFCNKQDQLKVYVTEGTRPGKAFHIIATCPALKDGQLNARTAGGLKRVPIGTANQFARACKTCWSEYGREPKSV